MKRVASAISPIISIDRKATEPLHRQIYDAYRSAIVQRRLRPRVRVPSTRVLAIELGVSLDLNSSSEFACFGGPPQPAAKIEATRTKPRAKRVRPSAEPRARVRDSW